MDFFSLENPNVGVSVSIDFTSKQDATFHCMAYEYYHADWDGLRDHLKDVPWENISRLNVSAAVIEFCERV